MPSGSVDSGRVGRVLIDSPLPQLDHLFDYAIPDRWDEAARPGVRVRVPLRSGGRVSAGYLVERVDVSEFDGSLSDIDEVVSPIPVLTPELHRLARAVADRAAGTESDVLRLAIPGRHVRVERAWLAEEEAASAARSDATSEARAGSPADAAADATSGSGARPAADAASDTVRGYPSGRLQQLVDAGGRAALSAIPRVIALPEGTTVPHAALTLAELAVHAWRNGRSAIIAVPDYRDQEQVLAALDALIAREDARDESAHSGGTGDVVLRTDARQTGPARYRSFLAALDVAPHILVGNRSAVYAPAHRLGLIALWDDGDALHSEPLAPGAHARDVALVRQAQSGAALVLAAHARSLEAQRLVELGFLTEVHPSGSPRPRVILTASSDDAPASTQRIPSAAWADAREASRTGPVLIQVSQPGYARALSCATCGDGARCARCGGPLALAGAGRQPSCRLCGAIAADWSCPNCHGSTMRLISVGADRTAEELGRAFPGVRIVIADGEHTVQHVGGEPAIVIATRGAEPLADGGYRAVLLLDGSRMLLRESLRVGEDVQRWWSNAAALAAADAPVHLIGVAGDLARSVATWRQDEWARAELETRRALRFPPAVRTVTVASRPEALTGALDAVRTIDSVSVLGPLDAGDGEQRAIVRFDYAAGREVAATLRASVIRQATARRRPIAGQPVRHAPRLKVRFDDPETL